MTGSFEVNKEDGAQEERTPARIAKKTIDKKRSTGNCGVSGKAVKRICCSTSVYPTIPVNQRAEESIQETKS